METFWIRCMGIVCVSMHLFPCLWNEGKSISLLRTPLTPLAYTLTACRKATLCVIVLSLLGHFSGEVT